MKVLYPKNWILRHMDTDFIWPIEICEIGVQLDYQLLLNLFRIGFSLM